MAFSYNRLWKLLIDRHMLKKDLQDLTGISMATFSKMGRCGSVTTEKLSKVCQALHCSIEDIMEYIPDEQIPLRKREMPHKNPKS